MKMTAEEKARILAAYRKRQAEPQKCDRCLTVQPVLHAQDVPLTGRTCKHDERGEHCACPVELLGYWPEVVCEGCRAYEAKAPGGICLPVPVAYALGAGDLPAPLVREARRHAYECLRCFQLAEHFANLHGHPFPSWQGKVRVRRGAEGRWKLEAV
jgi:hypothetical protein